MINMFLKIRHAGKARVPLINFQNPFLKDLNIRTSIKGIKKHTNENVEQLENFENEIPLREKISFLNRRTFIDDTEVDIINGYYEVPEFKNIKLKK